MGQITEGLVIAELAMVKAPYILIGPFYAVFVLTVLWVYLDRAAIVGVLVLLTVIIPLLGKLWYKLIVSLSYIVKSTTVVVHD